MRINRLKTTYQRNLLLGMAVSLLITAATATVILLSQESYIVIDPTRVVIFDNFPIQNNASPTNTPTPNPNFMAGTAPLPGIHMSSIDQSPIITDIIIQYPANPAHDAIIADNFVITRDDFGDYRGDFYLRQYPETPNADWPVPAKTDLLPVYSFTASAIDRAIYPPRENHPLLIRFSKPRHPLRHRYQGDATVKLGFRITEKGYIGRIDVIREEPRGYGFALAVKEALHESWIRPAVIDGQKTGGYYILTYEFCEACPQRPVVVESSENIAVTIE